MALIIVFVAALAALILLYKMVSPFLASRSEQARVDHLEAEIRQVELLAARKNTLVASLRELEYDHQLNKISDEDYERFRARYERQAVGVLRELDAIHGGRGWQDVIEAEINKRLGTEASPAAEVDQLQEQPSLRDATANTSTCLACGAPLESDDKFCSQCGEKVPNSTNAPMEASA